MIRLGSKTFAVTTLLLLGCSGLNRVERTHVPAQDVRGRDLSEALGLASGPEAYLKAHMMNGTAYVIRADSMETSGGRLVGEGMLLGVNRDTLSAGRISVPIDSVVLFETNTLVTSGPETALAVVTGVSVAVTAFCATNPKACFGSCPTFYTHGEEGEVLHAEGFSASISPVLEETDVDALYGVTTEGGMFDLEMRNEALETHVVRWADLLAVRRDAGSRVLRSPDGRFWEVVGTRPPVRCEGHEGNCLEGVRALDGVEYLSLADSSNLGTQEYIEIEMDMDAGKRYGLILGARQSLLPTFLLYQAFAYMGKEVGSWLARIERGDADFSEAGIPSLFKSVDVQLMDSSGEWTSVGTLGEHGPLATDLQILPLPVQAVSGRHSLRLRLTQGAWRLDHVGVGELADELFPERIRPVAALKEGAEDEEALGALLDPEASLTTLPGDSFILRYPVPEGEGELELFLESRGYYLEWIREEEEDPARLMEFLFDPETALKRLAPVFKGVESEMEAAFWRSRYARKN